MNHSDMIPLLSLPGVTAVLRFGDSEVSTFSKEGLVPSHTSARALGRGLLQTMRDARSKPQRLAVNGAQGRMIFQFLPSGDIVGVQATLDSEIPLLHLELDALVSGSEAGSGILNPNEARTLPPGPVNRVAPVPAVSDVKAAYSGPPDR